MEKLSSHGFAHRAAYLALIFRRNPHSIPWIGAVFTAEHYMSKEDVARLDVPKFKIWPAERLAARRDAKQLELTPELKVWLWGRRHWSARVKDWIKNGI